MSKRKGRSVKKHLVAHTTLLVVGEGADDKAFNESVCSLRHYLENKQH